MKNKQAELIKNLPDRILVMNVWLTQALVFGVAAVLGFLLFDEFGEITALFDFTDASILTWGIGIGIAVVSADILLSRLVPESWQDDGGINERIFRNLGIPMIALLSLCVAFSEELLFRGVIQTHTNLWAASLLFAAIHYRYLYKPFLLVNVTLVSLLIGWVFEHTGHNLAVTITMHFLIDFILGVQIRLNYKKEKNQIETD